MRKYKETFENFIEQNKPKPVKAIDDYYLYVQAKKRKEITNPITDIELVIELEKEIKYYREKIRFLTEKMGKYTVKETKGRTHFSTGAQRSDDTGKPKLALLPWDLFPRLAEHYEKGAKIFGDSNWRKGMTSSHVMNSMLRHVQQYVTGQTDEDHLSAIVFNALCLIYNEEKMAENEDVYDLPKWWKERGFTK